MLRTYRLLLDGDLGRQVERVVVFGHPTLSRPVSRLLGRDDVEVLAATRGIWADGPSPPRPAAAADGADDPSWFEPGAAADRASPASSTGCSPRSPT